MKKSPKIQSLLQLLLFAGIVVFLNILANARIGDTSFYGSVDLTEEKKFTLTKNTRQILDSLDKVIFVRVLLDGDFPAGFKRLQRETGELLEDFRSRSPLVEYLFFNPNTGSTEEINQRRQQFREEYAMNPVSLRVENKAGSRQEVIFPYAIVSLGDRDIVVNLLENEIPGVLPDEIINTSVELLEYKFINAIQKLMQSPADKPAILFTDGHGELAELETADLETDLRQFYNTGRIVLDSVPFIPDQVKTLIVAKPKTTFSEKDKFKIDQYIMGGGKVLWLIDPIGADLDSLRGRREFYPQLNTLNLDDQLFKYGVRIKENLVLDMQCSLISLTAGMVGNQEKKDYLPYPYHIVVSPRVDHPIVKGLGLLNLQYPSPIDTENSTPPGVDRTILLTSSEKSLFQMLPVGLDFNFQRYGLDETKFNKGPQPLAVLLEGSFPSFFTNRIDESFLAAYRQIGAEFKEKSIPTRMILVADGDMARNLVNWKDGRYSKLGFNPWEFEGKGYLFSNKDFLINAIEYLIDNQGVIEARSKNVELRLLDAGRAERNALAWRLLNIGVPLLLLVLFGALYNHFRRRRFASNPSKRT